MLKNNFYQGAKLKIPNDPFIQELLPEFVDSWIKDIDEQFDTLISSRNSQDLYRLAHTLKGSCYQFGLDDIAAMGIELMGYASDNDWNKCIQMKQPIKNSFLSVKEFLSKTSAE